MIVHGLSQHPSPHTVQPHRPARTARSTNNSFSAQLNGDPTSLNVATTPGGQQIAATQDSRLFFGAPTTTAQLPAGDLAPPANAPFVPTFRPAVSGGAQQGPIGLNPYYFASKDTAQWIANKYGTGEVVEVPFGGSGGPFSASENEYHVRLPNGHLVNAGILASYYDRNPESQFPGLADKLIRSALVNV